MAFSAILRKSAPSLAWLARVNRNHHSAIFMASSHLSWSSFVPIFRFSSAVESKKKSSYDESLIQLIDSEIKCAVEERDRSEWFPSGFPFKIEDNPGQQTIILTREYQDELPDLDPGEEIKYDEDFNYDTRRKVKPSKAIIPQVQMCFQSAACHLESRRLPRMKCPMDLTSAIGHCQAFSSVGSESDVHRRQRGLYRCYPKMEDPGPPISNSEIRKMYHKHIENPEIY